MSGRGFASLSPERLRQISSAGGLRRHELGVGHYFTAEEARAAGRKGGLTPRAQRRCSRCRQPGHDTRTCTGGAA